MSLSSLYTLLLLVFLSAVPLASALPIPDVVRATQEDPGLQTYVRIGAVEDKEAFVEAQLNLPSSPSTCSGSDSEQSLEFNLSIHRSFLYDLSRDLIYFDDHPLDIAWINGRAQSSQILNLRVGYSTTRSINVSWTGAADMVFPQSTNQYATHVLDFGLHEVPTSEEDAIHSTSCSYPNIILTDAQSEDYRVLTLVAGGEPVTLSQSRVVDSPTAPIDLMDEEPSASLPPSLEDEFDLAGELETLRLLEQDAETLQTQIAARKRLISQSIRQRREKLCLKHLLAECDGILCKAKAVVQRICDRMGIDVVNGGDDSAHIRHRVSQSTDFERHGQHNRLFGQVALKIDPPPQKFRRPQIFSEKQTIEGMIQPISSASRNPVVKILAAIAAALGLTALASFVRYRCMSMRRRVEHAADLEERRNARAYRRAACRAAVRRRWEGFLKIFSCFHNPEPSRQEDYDEKRALILQDAFLEQDVDLAEKGEIMEAEIRELRHAHEIVASLVRVDENRYVVAPNIYDPPPSLVPLPYTPGPRSRASTGTLGTLPSYFSESLPDYTSRPGVSSTASSSGHASDGGSDSSRRSSVSSVTQASTPPTMTQSRADCSGARSTPTSSVIYVSTRNSLDTLFTRQSRQS